MKIKWWELSKEILVLCWIAMLPGGIIYIKALFNKWDKDKSIGSGKIEP